MNLIMSCDILLILFLCFPEHKTRVFRAILEMLRWFAGHQIRNVAVSVRSKGIFLCGNFFAYIPKLMNSAFIEYLAYFFQSVAGNIMTASPISDLNPLFLAAGCKLIAISKGKAPSFLFQITVKA